MIANSPSGILTVDCPSFILRDYARCGLFSPHSRATCVKSTGPQLGLVRGDRRRRDGAIRVDRATDDDMHPFAEFTEPAGKEAVDLRRGWHGDRRGAVPVFQK